MAQTERLQKYLSACGVASRRKAEELIASGKVKVNGHVAQIGDKIDPKQDTVTVFGQRVRRTERNVYLMLYKPRGYLTTLSDDRGRKCVPDLLRDVPERVYPIGRLDKDSEGLLLLTNDGAFANLIMHPAHHIPKRYRVTVRPAVTDEQIRQMTEGMVIDGYRTAPTQVRVLEREDGRVVLEIVLYEGRNRQIRKMCEQLGLEVARLKRTAMGPVKLGMLQQGQYRELTADEVEKLQSLAERPTQEAE
ncbi:MAG: rRNA pseudouridine synthase [Clostridia bacterium]|nr:rRNA pseudouridine synthase [Clostridia bacterium]